MLQFNAKKYYSYSEITEFLQLAAQQYPDFIELKSIGTSYEKRKIWLISMTNKNTGRPEDKPSLWVDGNTHASEVAGAQSCLYFIHKTLTDMKKNKDLAFLLERMNFYILPQVSPDGAEFFLRHHFEIRSSPRPWPSNPVYENLLQRDINNDGEVLLMRKEDPAGAFKKSTRNKEIMVQRRAFDLPTGHQKYYKLYKEGAFQNFDHFNENQEGVFGLDFNRQFPNHFRPEGNQIGASAYPMSSAEIRSFVEAFIDRPRIFGHVALHTYGGLILRPPANAPESSFALSDLMILKVIADEAAQVSGYKSISTAQDFKYYARDSETGTADDWSFEQRGVFAFTVEIWDVWKAAGIEVKDQVSRYFNPPESEILKIFKWAKSKLQLKKFYGPWKKFKHPQLGDIEIGGWKTNYLFRNPPPELLKGELQKVNAIILQFAKILPLVQIKKIESTQIDEKTKKLVVIVENQGFLPTYGSAQAIKVGSVQKPTVALKSNSKLKMIAGKTHFETEHLQGRNRYVPFHSPVSMARQKNTNEFRFEWILQGMGTVEITFDYQRGGVLRTELEI